MPDPADPLAGLWAATQAPARDLAFELAVEEAVARRRLAADAATLLGVSAVAGLIAVLAGPELLPVFDALAAPIAQAGPLVVVSLAMAAAALWWVQPPPEPER